MRPGPILAGLTVAVALTAAVAPEVFTGVSPNETAPLHALRGPDAQHWFGTDQLGRDVFARVVHGTRPSLTMGLLATALATAAGLVWGMLAALGGRWPDAVLMRTVDVLLALPGLLLSLLVIVVLGHGMLPAAIAVAAAAAPALARVVRAQAMVVRRSTYVEAAVALGVPRHTVIARHVLPNTFAPVLALAVVTFAGAIAAGAALSYLGLGPQPPAPEWGGMLADGQNLLRRQWWVGIFPGCAVVATVLAVTVLGRQLQAGLEGRAVR